MTSIAGKSGLRWPRRRVMLTSICSAVLLSILALLGGVAYLTWPRSQPESGILGTVVISSADDAHCRRFQFNNVDSTVKYIGTADCQVSDQAPQNFFTAFASGFRRR